MIEVEYWVDAIPKLTFRSPLFEVQNSPFPQDSNKYRYSPRKKGAFLSGDDLEEPPLARTCVIPCKRNGRLGVFQDVFLEKVTKNPGASFFRVFAQLQL